MKAAWPGVFLVGAAKAGTTSLYAALASHGGLCAPAVKEPRHFLVGDPELTFAGPGDAALRRRIVEEPEAYRALYDGGGVGEGLDGSVAYLWSPGAARRIAAVRPDARILMVLRQPVDRAYSQWLHLVRDGSETLGFEDAWRAEAGRVARGWSYLWQYRGRGCYAAQVARYDAVFPAARIHVEVYDDLVREPDAVYARVASFCGLTGELRAPPRLNDGHLVRRGVVGRFLSGESGWKDVVRGWMPAGLRRRLAAAAFRWNRVEAPPLDPGLRARLTAELEPEIAALEARLGRSLAAWRQPRAR